MMMSFSAVFESFPQTDVINLSVALPLTLMKENAARDHYVNAASPRCKLSTTTILIRNLYL